VRVQGVEDLPIRRAAHDLGELSLGEAAAFLTSRRHAQPSSDDTTQATRYAGRVGPFSEGFLRALAPGQRALAGPDLEERLAETWRRARAAWPELTLAPEPFLDHLARHAPEHDLEGYLAAVIVEDLALAHACSRHDAGAIRELEARYLSTLVPRIVARTAPTVAADEVVQRLRERLLVGAGGPGKIADYSGRGPLAAWVRAAAVRTTLTVLRGQRRLREAEPDEIQRLPAAIGDPELELLRSSYAAELQAALQGALDTLPARARNLLRFSYLDRLGVDDIAAIYGVHRVTASRWLADARSAILTETRRILAERIRMTDSELQSLMRDLRSRIEITLRVLWT